MTRRQVLGLCIAISLLLHMWALRQDWGAERVEGGEEIVIPADFTIAAQAPDSGALALEQAFVPDDDAQSAERAVRRLRRQALAQYLRKVHEAVERRKFLHGEHLAHLIGNVLYSFRILPDDTFVDIRLKRSSGDPVLDRAARSAILAASGRVKRPEIIQGQTLSLSIAVKYQLNM
jgi:protein TonB